MKREQLTNVETEAQCQAWADQAMNSAKLIADIRSYPRSRNPYPNAQAAKADEMRIMHGLAQRIIALRSQQVTP
jgi:hypothetical protein